MTRIGVVRRLILSRAGESAWAPLWAFLAVTAPLLLRMAIDRWVVGVPFLTFFPGVLIATMLLGWRWGLAVLLLSALAANFVFQPPLMAFASSPRELVGTLGFLAFGGLVLSTAESLRRSVIELEARSQREAELNLELQHRVNNNLTVIQALAQQTARQSDTPDAFYAAFSERLLAVSEANKVLANGSWNIARLPDLAEAALRPFRGQGTIELQGPVCEVPGKSCVPLVLALHELGTNAVKYGALSTSNGCVRVRWALSDGRCRLLWSEEGGPSVKQPTRSGLGSRLLRRQPGLDAVKLTYTPSGVTCEILVPGVETAS